MHVHSLTEGSPEYFFPLLIANGVTGVRDMGSGMPLDRIGQIRNDVDSGKLVGPRFGAVTGKILDGPGTQLTDAIPIADPNEARQIVKSFKQGGVDFIKVYNRLSRDVYLAIVDEAKKQKLQVAGHVPFDLTAAQISDSRQASIEHVNDLFISASPDEKELRDEFRRLVSQNNEIASRVQLELKAASNYHEKRTKPLFARFVSNDTWQCPTLSVQWPSTVTDSQRLQTDRRLKYMPPSTRRMWGRAFAYLQSGRNVEQRVLNFQKVLGAVGAMQRAGVGILAGSDTPNPYVFPGFSLHDELALLVQAGLTPVQALRTATLNPARFLGMADRVGTIEKGNLADLVLLDANPLDDIRNTQRIYGVVVNGRYFPQHELKSLLTQAEANASKL